MAERLAVSRLSVQRKANFAPQAQEHANLGARVFAYAVDSLVLFAFTMLFVSAAFLNVFFRSDSGRTNPSDAVLWDSVAILMATVPAWLLFNLLLTLRRGQSVGQYIVGLRLVRERGSSPGLLRILVYWLALHPLLFHPLLAAFWIILGLVSVSLAESQVAFIGSVAVALLCLIAPLAGFLFALGDSERRGIHDWIAGTKLVRIE